jgi:hypothetical protein
MRLFIVLALAGCTAGGADSSPTTTTAGVTECAKVLCDPGQYCLSVIGGVPPDTQDTAFSWDVPECTDPPAACGGTASCACLNECTSCTEADGVYCEIALP